MSVLITGAGGQIGQALVKSAPEDVEARYTTHAELDIADADATVAFLAKHKPDLIINAAAYTAVDQAESEPETAREVNDIGARNLARAAADLDARIIQISTDFVFDGASSSAYSPSDATAPLGVYGTTKLAGERSVLETLPDRGVVLRTAWVYGPVGKNFLLTMLRLMRERPLIRVVSDQVGTPTAAASVARAIWAMASLPDLHGIYHWTDAGVASWYDFAVAIAEESARLGILPDVPEVIPISTQDYPTPARRPRFSVLDTRSTVDAIGIVPAHWRVNLRRILGEIHIG